MLRGNAIKALLGYNPIGSRIIMAQFKTTCRKTKIVQVYALTANSTDEEIEEFYSDLQNTIQRISKYRLADCYEGILMRRSEVTVIY